MKRRRRYTYVPKEEIAEIRTFNDVSFESDDLLDGAYVKGRKKFARGGVPKRALSLEEQAAEAVGYDVWYKMESTDQNELIGELVSSGMIAPMMADGGMMAKGGRVYTDEEIYEMIHEEKPPRGFRLSKEDYTTAIQSGMMYDSDKDGWVTMKTWNESPYGDDDDDDEYADGGEIEVGDIVKYKKAKYHATVLDVVDNVDIPYAKIEYPNGMIVRAYLEDLRKIELGVAEEYVNPNYMADGGVTGTTYVVKYSMKDTPEVVKEKVFADKDSAELFHETISDDEDLVVMDLQEVKAAPAPKPKKSLFESAKTVPATTAASKKKRERVQVDGIADQIARYDQLKATINNAKAEQEVIGGMLKEIGRDKFLEIYEERGVRPANFDLADGNENILLEVTDKYLKVEPEKAELLRQFDGLLEEKTTYEFDSDILEKEVSDGMTVGDVVSMLIQDSKLIPESDKPNLIKAKKTMRVPKGTIDRLMEYDNPREVFSLISPILALK